MKTTEVIIEAADLTGASKAAVENPIEAPNTGEGASRTIIGDNTKPNVGNTTPPTEAITIIIIITTIIKVEVDVTTVVIITEVTTTVEAVIEAITITNTTNITHMMWLTGGAIQPAMHTFQWFQSLS